MKKLKILLCAAFAVAALCAVSSASAAEVGTVTANSGLRLRSAASTSSSTMEIVEHGAQLVIIEVGSKWCKVNFAGKVGYMSTEYLDHTANGDFVRSLDGVITGSVVNFRSEPNTNCRTLGQLSRGSKVSIIGFSGGWYHIKSGELEGYIHPDYAAPTSAYLPSVATTAEEQPAEQPTETSDGTDTAEQPADETTEQPANGGVTELRQQVIDYAKQYIGTKYTYGGKSPSTGFDCSGFVYYVFKNFGYTLNPGASAQMKVVQNIRRSELVPGDLVFFNNGAGVLASHVGIYIGDNQFIHAVSPGHPVAINSISGGYYDRYFVAGGRVLPLE